MTVHHILVTVTYENAGSGFGPHDDYVADLVRAGLFKTYADPGRDDAGISTVRVRPMEIHHPGEINPRACFTEKG